MGQQKDEESKRYGCLISKMKNKKFLMGLLIVVLIGIIFLIYQKNFDQDNILTKQDIINRIESNKNYSCYNNDNYPKIIGKYSDNNLNVKEICFCSDYCPPELWHVIILYENVTSKEQCAEIGGIDRIDFAWGGYIGCAPNPE